MGKKVQIGDLSEEEQKQILDVINRDLSVRKAEAERLGKIKEDLDHKKVQVTTYKVPDADSACAICGTGFIWLFHPKIQCMLCKLFVCKNCPECRKYDEPNDLWLCTNCWKFRELQAMSLDWFYSSLKSKFRRHGGAKILREFYKLRKGQGEALEKPPRWWQSEMVEMGDADRVSLSDSEQAAWSEDLKIDRKDEVCEVVETEEATFSESTPHSEFEVRKEIEEVIISIILPKFEELKALQQPGEHRTKLAEMIEELIDSFPHEIDDSEETGSENALTLRYLRDHKQSIIAAVLARSVQQESMIDGSLQSAKSPLRDAETMTTDASDSELESIRSGSTRSRSSFRTPLSERMRNLSPDSLRSTLNAKPVSADGEQTVVQGVLTKDQMIARAEVDAAMAEMLDANEVQHDQEFSTELTFTAVSVQKPDLTGKSDDIFFSRASEEENSDAADDQNWIVPSNQQPQYPSLGKIRTSPFVVPETEAPSAYDVLQASTPVNDVLQDDVVNEDTIQPVTVSKSFTEVSARSLGADNREVGEIKPVSAKSRRIVSELVADDLIESVREDLGLETSPPEKQNKTYLPQIEEEPIEALDRQLMSSSVLPPVSAVTALQTTGQRVSEDSAYSSDVSSQSVVDHPAKQQAYEESESFSSSSSMDGSLRSTSKQRSSVLIPERDISRKSAVEKQNSTKLDESDEILVVNESFDKIFSSAIEFQQENEGETHIDGKLTKTEVPPATDDKTEEETSKRVRFATETLEAGDGKDVGKHYDSDEDDGDEDDSDDVYSDEDDGDEDELLSSTTEEEYDVIKRGGEGSAAQQEVKMQAFRESSSSSSSSSSSDSESDDDKQDDVTSDVEEPPISTSAGVVQLGSESLQSDSRSSVYGSDFDEMEMKFSVVSAEIGERKHEDGRDFNPQGKTIDEIVGELRSAGLQGQKCKVKRSSISPRPMSRPPTTEANPMKAKKISLTSPPPRHYEDATKMYGFTVDPATYRKPEQSERRSKSLMELLEADRLSSQSDSFTTHSSVEVDSPSTEIQREDVGEISLLTLTQRRSVFSEADAALKQLTVKNEETSPQLPSFAEKFTIKETMLPSKADVADSGDGDSTSFTSSRVPDVELVVTEEIVTVENPSIPEESHNRELETEARPSVKQVRQIFDLDRSSPIRGSITMRGGRMVAISNPEEPRPQYRFELKKKKD